MSSPRYVSVLTIAGRVFTGSPFDNAFDACESSAVRFAEAYGFELDRAFEELCMLELDGHLVEHLFLDGVEVDIADNL
jgi:hypothetical protein